MHTHSHMYIDEISENLHLQEFRIPFISIMQRNVRLLCVLYGS